MSERGRPSVEKPVKNVRLITFTQIPGDECEALDVQLERLSASSVYFENHYLQREWHLDAFDMFRRVRSVQFHLVTDALEHRSLKPAELPPDWTFQHQVFADSPSDLPDVLWSGCPGDDSVQWTHVHTSDPSRVANILQEILGQSIDPGSPAFFLVTTLEGLDEVDFASFDSLLPENSIRTPVWLLSNNWPSARVQAITGSCDIGFTIYESSVRGGGQPNSDASELRVCKNLLELATRPGQAVDRELLIVRPGIRAVRTAEFLFVQRFEEVDQTQQNSTKECALYAKPADVWNVNDVSGEFHEVVDRHRIDSV